MGTAATCSDANRKVAVLIAVLLAFCLCLPARADPGQVFMPPDPGARRSVVGPGRPDPNQMPADPVLRAFGQAERQLFRKSSSINAKRPSEFLPPTEESRVASSGLPPSGLSIDSTQFTALVAPDWIASLRPPDFPMRMNDRIRKYLKFYRDDPRGRAAVRTWYRTSGRYEWLVRRVLRDHGLPEDLLWVSVIESRHDAAVRSPVGAAGLWQFMRNTARVYGLTVDRWVDERLDPVRSTHAAALFLQDLHARFGSWELALAAYNMGYGGALGAIRRFNSNDYWALCRYEGGLPWETTLYVPKILSLAIVGKNPKVFGLETISKDAPLRFERVEAHMGVSVISMARAARVTPVDFAQLNPHLISGRIPPYARTRRWQVSVPSSRVSALREYFATSVRLLNTTRVKRGESLLDVALRNGVTRNSLARANAIRNDEVLREGTNLLLPRGRGVADAEPESLLVVLSRDVRPAPGFERVFHRVVDGEVLGEIAKKLSVRQDELRVWNGLDSGARLHSGMTLVAVVKEGNHVSTALREQEVRVVIVGSDAFFRHAFGRGGKVRIELDIRPGDTWGRISARTGMGLSMLERVNRRSRRSKLRQGETVVAYVPRHMAWMGRKRIDKQ